jgi:hypothetical protein
MKLLSMNGNWEPTKPNTEVISTSDIQQSAAVHANPIAIVSAPARTRAIACAAYLAMENVEHGFLATWWYQSTARRTSSGQRRVGNSPDNGGLAFTVYQNTNVVALHNRVLRDANQNKYYNCGIGTYVPHQNKMYRKYWKQKLANALDLAFALSVPLSLLSVTGN